MKPSRTDHVRSVKVLMTSLAFVIACLLFILLAVWEVTHAHADWKRVAGEWEQYRLNESQMQWFKSVRSKQGVPCCNIADGHPTEMKRLEDGYWIPNSLQPTGAWLKVPELALTIPPNNPIGVAVVWYVQNGVDSIQIRCFVPENES